MEYQQISTGHTLVIKSGGTALNVVSSCFGAHNITSETGATVSYI